MEPVEPTVAIVGGGGLSTEALAWMLARSGYRVLGAHQSFPALNAALDAGEELHAAIVDMDDPAAGPVAVAQARAARPELRILLLSAEISRPVVRCVIEHDVDGVALKSDRAQELVAALAHILAGRAVMPVGWQRVAHADRGEGRLAKLSAREREVAELVARGLSNREIAERLVISPNTVKFHLRSIYARLGVHDRLQATLLVGLVHDPVNEGETGVDRHLGWLSPTRSDGAEDYPS